MFERRLKIFLSILLVFVLVLLGRAMQLQVVEREHWRDEAAKSMRSEVLSETSRGRILDCKGAVLAEDQPCIDACIDYRILTDPPDDVFVTQLALKRTKERRADDYAHANTLQRRAMVKDETAALLSQIQVMWEKLAKLSSTSRDEIDAKRKAIQDRVELRRRVVWYQRYRSAQHRAGNEEPPWFRKWILGEQTDQPQIDDIANEPLKEELTPHVILEAIDNTVQNELQKHADEYPGLTLRPSSHRNYPYGTAACHLI